MSEYCPFTYKGYPVGQKYPWVYPMPSEKERDVRWKAIRRSMEKHNFDCLIVGATIGYMPLRSAHFNYISNYVPFSNHGTYIVFPLKGEPQLEVTSALGPQYLHVACETSWIRDIVMSAYPIRDVIKKIEQLKLQNGRLGVMGYNSGEFPASDYNALRQSFPEATFDDAGRAMSEAMNEVSRTSEEELAFFKKACELQDLSFEAVARALKPGVKECELWAAAVDAIVRNGGWYPHFVIATSGPSPTFMRAPASLNVLERGDIVTFELSAIYGGVQSHISYALSLGRPRRDIEDMFQFCEELYYYALVELEKKRTFMDIELDLASRIHTAGYEPMTPQIHIYNMAVVMPMNDVPQPGDRFAVHTNFADRDYTRSAKAGDSVLISRDGKVERVQKTLPKLNVIDV